MVVLLVLALLVGVCRGGTTVVPQTAAAATDCGNFGCGRATSSCELQIVDNLAINKCVCLPHFDLVDCSGNRFSRLGSSKMYPFWVVMLLAWGITTIFAISLLRSYYKLFARMAAQSPQRFGIWFCAIAAACRTLNVLTEMSIGPDYEVKFFQDPSFVMGLLRYSFGLFYPLAVSAYTLQIFLWAEICHAVGHSQGKTGGGFLPRLKPLFVAACIAVFVFEVIVQAVLTAQPAGTLGGNIILVYRILLALTIILLILGGSIFGIRLVGLLKATPNMSDQKKSPKIFLSKLIVFTCVFLTVGLLLSLALAFTPWEDSDLGLYSSAWVSRLIEVSMLLLILFTFSKLLKNQQERAAKHSQESGDTASTERGSHRHSGGSGGFWQRITSFSISKKNPSVAANLLEEDHLADLEEDDDTLLNELNELRTVIDEVPSDDRGVRWPTNSKLNEYSDQV